MIAIPCTDSSRNSVHPGSHIEMTPSAYMTDEVYLKIVPRLAAGIWKMPIIKDHLNWWVLISLDGYRLHINIHEANQIFADHKILIIKEQGDSSQVNQAYDQFVVKKDRIFMWENLQRLHKLFSASKKIDQWMLVAIAMDAQNKVTKEGWISSTKSTQSQALMYPSTNGSRFLMNTAFLSWVRSFLKRECPFLMQCQPVG